MRRNYFFGAPTGAKYFKTSDVTSGPATFTIRNCGEARFGKDQVLKPVLFFENDTRGLILNETNWNTLADCFGEDSDDWIGQCITLRIENGVYRGQPWTGIRVGIPDDDARATSC